jgi:antitoxin (DNA-binding transcriptional repressor) of toxin-antitoxin stability system
MKKLTIREARQSLSHLDQFLDAEGEVIITKRGREIARAIPFSRKPPIPSHQDLREKMPLMAMGSEDLVGDDRDARRHHLHRAPGAAHLHSTIRAAETDGLTAGSSATTARGCNGGRGLQDPPVVLF